jgi:hypothetical protein
MAESKPTRRRKSSGSSRSSSSGKSSSRPGGRGSKKASTSGDGSPARSDSSNDLSPREVVLEAARQLQELVGRPVESIIGIEKNGKEWKLSVEVLELERVPNTTDLLGIYDVTVDKNGELTGARRTRRYPRAEARED